MNTHHPMDCPAAMAQLSEVGYVFANIKTISDAQIGDTIADGTPPAADTRRIGLSALAENRMTPSRFHVPPRPSPESQSFCGGPPATAIL